MEWLFVLKIKQEISVQLQPDEINAPKIVNFLVNFLVPFFSFLSILPSFFVIYEITISNQPSAI